MNPCPVCEGSRRIKYADIYLNHATKERKALWEIGREIACGCVYLTPILGEAS